MDKPLQGRRILVTRPAGQARALAAMIAAAGGEPVCFPLLEIAPMEDLRPLWEAADRLGDFSLAIFVSPNAVEHGLPHLLARRPWPPRLQAAAIGQGTAARLAAHGIGGVAAPAERFDSEALLALPACRAGGVAGRKVLILRGDGGRELLAETLCERGAEVTCVACYRRSAPADGTWLASLLRDGGLDALTLSSSEGLRNLLALLDADGRERLAALPVFVPHARIAEAAAALGLRRIVATPPGDAGTLAGLCAYDWSAGVRSAAA